MDERANYSWRRAHRDSLGRAAFAVGRALDGIHLPFLARRVVACGKVRANALPSSALTLYFMKSEECGNTCLDCFSSLSCSWRLAWNEHRSRLQWAHNQIAKLLGSHEWISHC